MKIRLYVIGPAQIKIIRREVENLSRAVNSGNMDAMDLSTAKLMDLTADCPSADLPEREWKNFLEAVRIGNPAFESSYLLDGPLCAKIFPCIGADDHVLELPIDSDTDERNTGV